MDDVSGTARGPGRERREETIVDTLRFGVLGSAKIAREKVIPAMQRGGSTDVVAIASRDVERAREAAAALGVPRAHGSYEDLLADEEVDAVYVPLPNHLHAPWTIAAARAGKHVLCEKPMALDRDEAEEMLATCEDAGVTFMEAFMYRVHPQWVRARELAASGTLGELRAVQSFFSYHNEDPSDIRNVVAYGGGALMDIGCYCIDVARLLFDAEPEEVTGTVHRHPAFGTDVVSSATLRFAGGRQATFTCSTQCAPHQHVRVLGTEGHLEIETPFNAPPDAPTRLRLTRGGTAEEISVPAADQYTLQGDAFAAAVLQGTPVPVPHATGVGVLAVIETLLSS